MEVGCWPDNTVLQSQSEGITVLTAYDVRILKEAVGKGLTEIQTRYSTTVFSTKYVAAYGGRWYIKIPDNRELLFTDLHGRYIGVGWDAK